MPIYSISRIGVYEKCPLKYKFCYIEKIRPKIPTTAEAFLGSCVHEALEILYREKGQDRVLTLGGLLDVYGRIWKEKWEDEILIVNKDKSGVDYRKEGERQLRDYYARYFPFEEGHILGLETWERLPLDEEGRYCFHIRIDRLMDRGGGLFEIHDYKCGHRLETQERLDQDEQLAIYSLWVRKRFAGCRDVRLVWHFTAFDVEMESRRTLEQLESLRMEILQRIGRIEAAVEFPPNVTRLCDWCEYRTICPEWVQPES